MCKPDTNHYLHTFILTYRYLLGCPETQEAVLVDPVDVTVSIRGATNSRE